MNDTFSNRKNMFFSTRKYVFYTINEDFLRWKSNNEKIG